MEVNIAEIKKLLEHEFNGNQRKFSKILKIDRTHLNKVLNSNGKCAGKKFCGAIIKYCIDNNLNYKNFIIFEQNVKKSNRKEN